MRLAELEESERAMRALVRSHDGTADELRALVEARMWLGCGARLGGGASSPPGAMFHEPHALGWLHQYLGAQDRQSSFRAHTREEAKHHSPTVSTQLFTPRWVADWLIAEALAATAPGAIRTVLDPACGGGQMLLAAVDALIDTGSAPRDALRAVRGVDLDPTAVATCRTTLKIHAARLLNSRDAALEAAIDAQVRVADGLFDDVAPADIVVTNPPYMGTRSMPPALKARLAGEFPGYHHDLFLAFVARCAALTTGSVAILTQQTLWYLKRFEHARRDLLARGGLTAVAHLGHGVFEALGGEKATVMAWVWSEEHAGATRFYDLRSHRTPQQKRRALMEVEPSVRDTASFAAIPAAGHRPTDLG